MSLYIHHVFSLSLFHTFLQHLSSASAAHHGLPWFAYLGLHWMRRRTGNPTGTSNGHRFGSRQGTTADCHWRILNKIPKKKQKNSSYLSEVLYVIMRRSSRESMFLPSPTRLHACTVGFGQPHIHHHTKLPCVVFPETRVGDRVWEHATDSGLAHYEVQQRTTERGKRRQEKSKWLSVLFQTFFRQLRCWCNMSRQAIPVVQSAANYKILLSCPTPLALAA